MNANVSDQSSAKRRYHWRLRLVPALANAGRRLGFSWSRLGSLLGREALISQVAALRAGDNTGVAKNPLKIVFLTMMGGNTHNVSVEVVLAKALESRGHDVRFVLCDRQLPVCEIKHARNQNRWVASCDKCYSFGRRYLDAADLSTTLVSEMIAESDFRSEDNRWCEQIESALLKHYRVGVLAETPEVERRRSLFREAADMSARVGETIAGWTPDLVVMSHGIYTTWGPQYNLLREADIPVVTYGKGKKKSTLKANWNTTADWWGVESDWEIVKHVPLSSDQEEALDTYLNSRRDHSADTLQYNLGDAVSVTTLKRQLGLRADRETHVLFTNVLWDAASTKREIVFDDPVHWVVQTILRYRELSNKQLVVRIHPAEVVIGTNQPFAQIIHEAVPEIPANVVLVAPEDPVNSWSLIDIADLGLVHTSTVGLELALSGKPCIIVSKTHYRGKGFTCDVSTGEEYFGLLADWDATAFDSHSTRALARRYAFLLFERYQLPFDLLYEVAHTDVRALTCSTFDELLVHDSVKLFVDCIEGKSSFVLPS